MSGAPQDATPAAVLADDVPSLRRILAQTRTIAVVGLSADWFRPSHFVAKYLQEHGYRIIPVNPRYTEILGERCHPDLASIAGPVDMVDVFRKPADAPAVAREAVAIGARTLWLQIGVVSPEAVAIAQQGGLEVVMDRCVKIEHARLSGGLNWFGVNTGLVSARRPR
ncbi:MAG: CoA-binding protein [Pseudomonadota bacterium]|nr:CoA-binding protein [Pseudomonadota bacterium]